MTLAQTPLCFFEGCIEHPKGVFVTMGEMGMPAIDPWVLQETALKNRMNSSLLHSKVFLQ